MVLLVKTTEAIQQPFNEDEFAGFYFHNVLSISPAAPTTIVRSKELRAESNFLRLMVGIGEYAFEI